MCAAVFQRSLLVPAAVQLCSLRRFLGRFSHGGTTGVHLIVVIRVINPNPNYKRKEGAQAFILLAYSRATQVHIKGQQKKVNGARN